MTAQPISTSLAKVRKLLPVKLGSNGKHGINVIDKNGRIFCLVPQSGDDTVARAELIRDAMNGMA